MKKVYVLFWCEWDSSEVLGVYGSRASALRAKAKVRVSYRRNVTIEEHVLNAAPGRLDR